ncbi:Ig-like domain-containing protein [Escherichia coli]|uniref:Ig-like domain-containing protein n=1 Tax=Escherichia coli TaxID=562 RepID=UPI003D30F0FD
MWGTTTLTFTVKPDGASDKAISVHSTDPQTATVTLNGLVATVKGVKQGSVSIVGMTSDGDFVAVATGLSAPQVNRTILIICPGYPGLFCRWRT